MRPVPRSYAQRKADTRADPIARTACDRLPDGRKREHVRAIESAKKPETPIRRIEKALATLRGLESA